MLVTHLTVGGLRAFGPEPVDVPLAPLTMVFGPNSAGKSSLLSILPMLQQTASDPDTLAMSGALVEGGTFRTAIHQHDDSLPLTLGFGWRTAEGALRRGWAEFAWDADVRAARRRRMFVDDGTSCGIVTGSRPWAGQPAGPIARAMAPEFFDLLTRVHFLGPMRARPERTTMLGLASSNYVGPAGERLAEVMSDHPDLAHRVNEWSDRLGLGYHIKMLTPYSHDIVVSAGDFTVLALLDVRREPKALVSPRAVGYGVGQLLPVIAQCLLTDEGMVLVEQPEVHLHPRLQSAVADLFVDTAQSGRAQLVLETHSEHVLLRSLRRVREGTLDKEDLSILYVDLHDDGAAFVRQLEVTDDGELADGWPGGFFDERLADVLPGLETS